MAKDTKTAVLAPRNSLQRAVSWLTGRHHRGELQGEAVALVAYQFRRTSEDILFMIAELEEAMKE